MGRGICGLNDMVNRHEFRPIDGLEFVIDWSIAIPLVIVGIKHSPCCPSPPVVVKVACGTVGVGNDALLVVPVQCFRLPNIETREGGIVLAISGLLCWDWSSTLDEVVGFRHDPTIVYTRLGQKVHDLLPLVIVSLRNVVNV